MEETLEDQDPVTAFEGQTVVEVVNPKPTLKSGRHKDVISTRLGQKAVSVDLPLIN